MSSTSVKEAFQEARLDAMIRKKAAPELAQDAVVEAGVRELKAEQVLPVDAGPNGVSSLAVA
jgi:peptidyl-tRNA hydrolase